jgi:hypothetical protein
MGLINHDTADGFAALHQIKSFIDFFKRHGVGNEIVDIDLAIHIPIHDFGHVSTAACATEGRAFPLPTGDELKWAGADFSARFGDTNDDALAPALMGALQRLPHHLGIADAFEAVISTTIGEFNNVIHNIF